MKEGFLQKSAGNTVSDEELRLINQYTRRPFTADEVYTFSVVLCDNEIDRDYECFTEEALYTLCRLYVGKTGIFDHNHKSSSQTARIYACTVEKDPARRTLAGEEYACLVAKAYLPRCQKNEDFIMELDSGIKKEVSVGCAVGRVECSICHKSVREEACRHQKGKCYGAKKELCYHRLSDPKDAYEWSFVAVPAQRGAGVVKAFYKGEREEPILTEDLIKALAKGEELTLSDQECKTLSKRLEELSQLAEEGMQYREQLRRETVRLGLIAQPHLSAEVLSEVSKGMSLSQLRSFHDAFLKSAEESSPPRPQLAAQGEKEQKNNTQFQI